MSVPKKDLALAKSDLISKFETAAGRALMSTAERLDLVGMGLQFGEAFYSNTALVVVEMIELGEEPQLRARHGEDLVVHVPNRELRLQLSGRLLKCKWNQQQVGELFGVHQTTIGADFKEVLKSEGVEKPKQKPRGKQAEPQDAETVELFRCVHCDKDHDVAERTELDDGLYCNACLEAIEEAAAHQESNQNELQLDNLAEDRAAEIVVLQEQFAKLAAKTPWTPAHLKKIVRALSTIREAMDQ